MPYEGASLPAILVHAEHDGDKAPLPAAAEDWLRATWSVKAGGREAEWSVDEVYLPLPKAGGQETAP